MSTSKFTEHDHARLATLFQGVNPEANEPAWGSAPIVPKPYAGYKPEVREAPNGDTKVCARCAVSDTGRRGRDCIDCHGTGRVPNVDAEGVCELCLGDGRALSGAACLACHGTGRTPAKRYLHVAPKYHPPQWAADYYDRAFAEACRVATALGVPAAYRPHEAFGALRVLEYPPGAGTVEHTDFDLFSIVLWRSTPGDLELVTPSPETYANAQGEARRRMAAREISPGLHIGEIGELVGLGPATPHRVPARPYAQKSLIYFAIPDHAARLPRIEQRGRAFTHADGPTVDGWLKEREKRSRY